MQEKQYIHIKGARSNNLKNIELKIPKDKLIVVTGLSGSGKSSLIMDTLYAEGQRRYVESLSSYARQFLSRMKKPEVDFIKGICPAIAIEQKVTSANARSTVGSLTEIYDYLRLMFARIGDTYSPVSGQIVRKHEISDVVDFIKSLEVKSKVFLYIPIQDKYTDRSLKLELELLLQKGFSRIKWKNELLFIEDVLQDKKAPLKKNIKSIKEPILVLIDRFIINDEEENIKRIADSVQAAFTESLGDCIIETEDGNQVSYNNRFELDGILFIEPSHQLFNYNNPYGACNTCEGYGRVLGIDPKKVVPLENKSVYDGAIACWRGEKNSKWLERFIENTASIDFPIHKPYKELTDEQKELLWEGSKKIKGIYDFFAEIEKKMYKIQNRVLLARYRGRTKCHKCKGGKLRTEASYVKIDGKSIMQLNELPIDELQLFFKNIQLSDHKKEIAKRILIEINTRLKTMMDVGLPYLSLDRLSATLSGGETQRINLTRTLGSNLTSSLYILDEPSIGLHPRDTARLVTVLKKLRDLGNTVIVVEHEEEIIQNSDYIIDVGPKAGIYGGEIVFADTYTKFKKGNNDSLTAAYISGEQQIEIPKRRRKFINKINIKNASHNNLKDIDVTLGLNMLNVVSGVSGSGKTSLVKHILYPALKAHLGEATKTKIGDFNELTGDLSRISQVELINQSPIGKSSRSNPVTYVKAYDAIRRLMANQHASKIKGFDPKHFSFNVDGGRCDKCKGEGEITIEMQFLADVKLTCEDCNGKRFKQEVLEVRYKEKNIADILDMSIEESIAFFDGRKDILTKMKALVDVGLGYVKLGQSSSTLSGGEAQRVKLASFLSKGNTSEHVFFIFDEPTTGLHFHDIQKLLDALNALIEKGHTVLVVEHNMEVIKSADWLVDLGPEGGVNGGQLVFEGTPEDLVHCEQSYTAKYLNEKI